MLTALNKPLKHDLKDVRLKLPVYEALTAVVARTKHEQRNYNSERQPHALTKPALTKPLKHDLKHVRPLELCTARHSHMKQL